MARRDTQTLKKPDIPRAAMLAAVSDGLREAIGPLADGKENSDKTSEHAPGSTRRRAKP